VGRVGKKLRVAARAIAECEWGEGGNARVGKEVIVVFIFFSPKIQH